MSIRRTSVDRETAVGQLAGASLLRRSDRADDLDGPGRRGGYVGAERHEPTVHQHRHAVVLHEGGHDVVAGDAVLGSVEHDDLLGQPGAGRGGDAPRRVDRV